MSVLQEYDFFIDSVPIVIRITDDAYVDANEDYLTDGTAFSVSGLARVTYSYSNKDDEVHETNSIYLQNSTIWEYYPRRAGYLSYDGSKYNIVGSLRTGNRNVGFSINGSANLLSWYAPSGSNLTRVAYDFCTNIPIFDSQENAIAYVTTTNKNAAVSLLEEHCINYKSGVNFDDTTKEYYAYNRYENVSIERGIITNVDNIVHQLNERILFNGNKICFYRTSSNPFILKLKWSGDVVGSYFSNSKNIDDIPYSQFTDGIQYETPFYTTYDRSFEIYDYNGNIAIGLSTNIPIWNSESNADAYLNGQKDITESENWDRISNDSAFSNIITNLTEQPESQTEFGEVYVRNIFSQLYLCDSSALYEISNNLFDYTPDATIHGQWEKIKEGLEMYGSNPMDAVQGLRFYPFDLTNIFTNVSQQNYVYFGAYKQDISGSVYKLIYANGYKDLGSITIKRTFKDWRDFEPYTRLFIYLPYVGKFQLDLSKYYDKTITIRYYIDLRTGGCCACLIANGVLLDWFDGIIGTEMPITLTDYASYAQNQISIIARNAGIGGLATALTGNAINKELATHLGSQEIPAAASGEQFASLASTSSGAAGTAGMVAGGIGLAAGVGAVVAGAVMKTRFDMTNNGIGKYNSTRGSSSAMLNQFLPQYPTFMFEVQEIDESPYLNELYGRPSNASGRLGDFSGYLEAEDIMLICPIATDNERQEIIDLVKTGIYI